MEMEETQNSTLYSGAKSSRDRINLHLYLSQDQPSEPEYRFNLATEVLTLLSKEKTKKDYAEFEGKLKNYKREVSKILEPLINFKNPNPYNRIYNSLKSSAEQELFNLNHVFDLDIRKVLRKFDHIMVDKKTFPNIIINCEGVLK